MRATFTYTDNSADPCMLCVGCDYGLNDDGYPEQLDPDQWRFYGPDGRTVTRIYRDLHADCAEAMDRYTAENAEGSL